MENVTLEGKNPLFKNENTLFESEISLFSSEIVFNPKRVNFSLFYIKRVGVGCGIRSYSFHILHAGGRWLNLVSVSLSAQNARFTYFGLGADIVLK